MKKLKIILLFTLILIPGIAIAETNAWNYNLREFVTHNGFDPVVTAFQFIAHIFSDRRFEVVFEGILIFSSIVAIGIAWKNREEPIWALAKLFMGAFLYICFISPKGTIHIYDTVTNQYQAVGGVPEGIIAVAGFFNKIENGLIDIVSTAGDPVSFDNQAGGFGLDVARKLLSDKFQLQDQYIHISIQRYFEDCVYFEMARPGSTLSLNDFYNSSDFIPLFAKADNPAIYTVWWDKNNKQGTTMTCYEAWHNHLKPYLDSLTDASATVIGIWDAACGEAGVDTSDPNQVQNCRQKTVDLVNAILGGSYTSPQLIKQYLLASEMNDVITRGGTEATSFLASRNTGTALTGVGINLNNWMPVIRGGIISVAVLMLPLMALLLATPIWNKAVSVTLGMFIWLTAWGVVDAGIHQMCLHELNHLFTGMRMHGLGLNTILSFSNEAAKGLAFFGSFRSAGLMLAAVISSMLVGFGGSALAHLAGGVMAPIKSAGMEAAMKTQTPEQSAGELNALEMSIPTWTNAYKFRYRDRVDALSMEKVAHTKSELGMFNYGGGNVDGASDLLARGELGHKIENIATGTGGGNAILDYNARHPELGPYGAASEAIFKKQQHSLEKFGNLERPIEAGQKDAADINAKTDNWMSLISGIAGSQYGTLGDYTRSNLQAIDDITGREFKGDISQIASRAVSTAARQTRQRALYLADKYAEIDSETVKHALNSAHELMHSKAWNERAGNSENWKTVEDITKKLDSYYSKTRKLGISDKTATKALLSFMADATGETGLSILGNGVQLKGGIGAQKDFTHNTDQTRAIEDAARTAMSLAKSIKREHALDAFKQVALSTNDQEARRNLASIGFDLQDMVSHSKEVGQEFRQADALEKMARDENALRQSLGTDPRHLFEAALVKNHGIEGAKNLLQRAQTDEKARMEVLTEYQRFLTGFVKENADTLTRNLEGYNELKSKGQNLEKMSINADGLRKKVTNGLEDAHSRLDQPLSSPQGYGQTNQETQEKLKILQDLRSNWGKIKAMRDNYVLNYGPEQFYLKTGLRPKEVDEWEKHTNDLFNHGLVTKDLRTVDNLLNRGLGIVGTFTDKVINIYGEGASRFPNEDAPHSILGKQLEDIAKK